MGNICSRKFEVFTQIDMNIIRSRNTHNWLISSKSFIRHDLTSFQLWCYTISHFPFDRGRNAIQRYKDSFEQHTVKSLFIFIVFDLVRAVCRMCVCLSLYLWISFRLINCLRQIDFDASLRFALFSYYMHIYMFSFSLISYVVSFFSLQFLFQLWWFNLHVAWLLPHAHKHTTPIENNRLAHEHNH